MHHDELPQISQEEFQLHIIELLDEQDAPVNVVHPELFESLLANLPSVDFHEEAGLPYEQTITQKTLIVLVVRIVLRIALSINLGLRWREPSVYGYNGHYWKAYTRPELEAFLGEAAMRLGVDAITAQHYRFRENLVRQFISAGHSSEPVRHPETTLINFTNGTYEFGSEHTGFREPRPDDFLTYQLPFRHDAGASSPKWQAHLDRVLPDADAQKVLSEYFAYIFTDLNLEKTLLLYGTGANGKSVVSDVLTALLGPENISHFSLQDLGTDYCRACIADKLLNYCSEISSHLDAAVFKQLTSGEPIAARLPYCNPITMHRYAKLAFNCNELPRDVEHNLAFFRRFLILPFTVTIPENEQNPGLANEIIAEELSGVFNWLLEGLARVLAQGKFTDCALAREMLNEYRKESDTVALFVEEFGYTKTLDREKATPLKQIYMEYKSYCIDNGFRPVSRPKLSKRLQALGFEAIKTNRGRLVFATYEKVF